MKAHDVTRETELIKSKVMIYLTLIRTGQNMCVAYKFYIFLLRIDFLSFMFFLGEYKL